MTQTTRARIAGVAYLYYIAAGVLSAVLFGRAAGTGDPLARLERLAEHGTTAGFSMIVSLSTCFAALALAISFHGMTRHEDDDTAAFGMVCRVAEAVIGCLPLLATAALLRLAAQAGRDPDAVANAGALADVLFRIGANTTLVAATFFAAGSTAFCVLLLRGHMIPRALAWLGVVGSVLILVAMPARMAGFAAIPAFSAVWIPVALFEVAVAVWFLARGVAEPVPR